MRAKLRVFGVGKGSNREVVPSIADCDSTVMECSAKF